MAACMRACIVLLLLLLLLLLRTQVFVPQMAALVFIYDGTRNNRSRPVIALPPLLCLLCLHWSWHVYRRRRHTEASLGPADGRVAKDILTSQSMHACMHPFIFSFINAQAGQQYTRRSVIYIMRDGNTQTRRNVHAWRVGSKRASR